MVNGMVYMYTGEGEGKTTNALGLALRAVGHGHRVIIIQFMKGRKYIGEYKVKDGILKLLKNIPEETTVILTGRRAPEELVERADLVTEMKFIKHPFEKNVLAREGLEY